MPESDRGENGSGSILDTVQLQPRLRSKALRGGGFTLLSQSLGFGIQSVGAILLARLLKPSDFGLVAMVSAFLFLIQNFGLNGFVEAIVQQEEISQAQLSKLFWINALIMLGLTLAFMGSTPLIAWFYKEPQLVSIGLVMSVAVFIGGFRTCHYALLVRRMDFHLTALSLLLAAFFSTIIAVGMALRGLGVWALVIKQVSEPLLVAGFFWLFCPWRPAAPRKGVDIRPLLAFGVRTYGSFLIDSLRKSLSGVGIGRFFGKTSLGYYERADQLSAIFPQMTSQIAGVGIATLSRLRGDPERYLSYLAKAFAVLAVFAFPFGFLMSLFGKDVVLALLGPQWSKAGDLLMILGPAIGFMVVYDVNMWIHISLGRPDRLFRWGVIMVLCFTICLFGGGLFGLAGVAAGLAALYHLAFLPALVYAGGPMQIKASFFARTIWKFWLAAVVTATALGILLHLLGPTAQWARQIGPWARVLVGGTLYGILYLVLGHFLFGEMRPIAFVRSILREMTHR